MVETAIAHFGLDLDAAWDLTVAGYTVMARAYRRRVRDQHERDVWHAWMAGQFSRGPVPYKTMLKLARGRGAGEAAEETARTLEKMARRAAFEDWLREELAREAGEAQQERAVQ